MTSRQSQTDWGLALPPASAGRRCLDRAAQRRAPDRYRVASPLGSVEFVRLIDTGTDDDGRPSFELTGTVAARAAELGVTHTHVSISHDAGVAVAMVVLES